MKSVSAEKLSHTVIWPPGDEIISTTCFAVLAQYRSFVPYKCVDLDVKLSLPSLQTHIDGQVKRLLQFRMRSRDRPNDAVFVLQLSHFDFKSRINDRDFDGMTPLHLAAARGHAHLITWLVDHGAKFLVDCMGGTALHFAAANGKLEVILENKYLHYSLLVIE